jgi:uridine phosphorylase
MSSETTKKSDDKPHLQMIGTEFPLSEDGRTYHLQTKKGEVANRIICVGDLGRAERYSQNLDKDTPIIKILSSRGFLTLTGKYKGTPVTILGSGMGISMIDFAIREVRGIMDGKFAMVRVGTCGTPSELVSPGDVVIQTSGVLISRNPDAFRKDSKLDPFNISQPVDCDTEIPKLLRSALEKTVKPENIFEGLGASADSFYSSQGRVTGTFDDRNEDLIDGKLLKRYPKCMAIEMETFHLFDMAECSRGQLIAGSMVLVLAQRKTQIFVQNELKEKREAEMGVAGLEAIIQIKL